MQRRSFLTGAVAALAMPAVISSSAHAAVDAAQHYEIEELRHQGFAGLVSYPELAEDLGFLAPLKLNWVGNTISGPQDLQAVMTRDVDFGGAFNGSVAKLIAAGAPAKAVIGFGGADKETWAGAYVLDDSAIKTPRDLIGRKVAVNTLGAQSEFSLKTYLERAGLTAKEIAGVTLIVLPPINSEQALREKQIDAAVLYYAFRDRAVARGGVRLLFSEYDLYGALTMDAMILRSAFIQRNPNVTRKFVAATAQAIDWVESRPREEVIARFAEIFKKRGRGEDPVLATYWKSSSLGAKGGVLQDRDFSIFLDWYQKHGELQAKRLNVQDFYTNEFNPFRVEVKQGG